MPQSTNTPQPPSEDTLRITSERMELLEVIREIVEQEIDAKLKTFMQGKFNRYNKKTTE